MVEHYPVSSRRRWSSRMWPRPARRRSESSSRNGIPRINPAEHCSRAVIWRRFGRTPRAGSTRAPKQNGDNRQPGQQVLGRQEDQRDNPEQQQAQADGCPGLPTAVEAHQGRFNRYPMCRIWHAHYLSRASKPFQAFGHKPSSRAAFFQIFHAANFSLPPPG